MVGGTGKKLTEATTIVAGTASLVATVISIVYAQTEPDPPFVSTKC